MNLPEVENSVPKMATSILFRLSLVCAICAFVTMFLSFTSPFWYKSWTRVHSAFSNIGLWHICLAGYIKPRDPVLKSYVGCWWIHSSEFDSVKFLIMPSWFMGIQALSIFTIVANLVGLIMLILYIPTVTFNKVFKGRHIKMLFITALVLIASAFLVFIIALVFAEMCNDGGWMPRPWMNYLSWGYGLCVLSGFFAAFGGMFIFLRALIMKDQELRGDDIDGRTAMAERIRAKEMEIAREQSAPPDYQSGRFEEISMQRAPYVQQSPYAQQPTNAPQPTYAPQQQEVRAPYRPDMHLGRQFDYVPRQRDYRTGSETYSGYHSGSESSAVPSGAQSTKAESVV